MSSGSNNLDMWIYLDAYRPTVNRKFANADNLQCPLKVIPYIIYFQVSQKP